MKSIQRNLMKDVGIVLLVGVLSNPIVADKIITDLENTRKYITQNVKTFFHKDNEKEYSQEIDRSYQGYLDYIGHELNGGNEDE